MDLILKISLNMVKIYQLVKIDFEEDVEVDILRTETIDNDSPASISGIYEDPHCEMYCSTPAVMADVTFHVSTPSARADGTFHVSTPAARADGTFDVTSGIYEDPEEGDCRTDNRLLLNVTYSQEPLPSTTTSTSSQEESLTEECVLALALAYTNVSISALEDSVFE